MKRTLVLMSLVWAGCGDNHHPPRLLIEVGDHAPAYGHAPWPTDALREGHKLGRPTGFEAFIGLDRSAQLVTDHFAELDGFGLRPTIEFFVQGALDPATIPATTSALTDALFVLDADPDTVEAGAPIAFDWRYDVERGVIAGSPALGVQLREDTRYAAVLTTDVHNFDGDSVYPGTDLGVALQDPPPRWETTGAAYKEIAAFPEVGKRIAGLTVFTTQRATEVLVKARNEIANVSAVPPPVLTFDDPALIFDSKAKLDALLGMATLDTVGPRAGEEQWGTDNPTGIAHEHIAVVATGHTTIARFVRDDTGTDGPDDETFELGADGVPRVQDPAVSIPITIVLPRGPMPADGFPVVVFGHGLGGSRHDVLDIAEPIASQGYALVAIDLWGHGSRYDATDLVNNLASKEAFTGDKTLHDGFGDEAGTATYLAFFENFMNFGAIRDSIRQSTLDMARVAMLVRTNPSLAALGAPFTSTPKLDPTKVAYLAQSFGTIVGVDLAAIEPTIGLYVLDVPGGGLIDWILPNSPKIGDLAVPFAEELYRTTGTLDRFHPLVGALQAIFDGADSLTFARHVLKDRFFIENELITKRHVVALEVMNDEAMPNIATEALARAFGMHVLKPYLDQPEGMLQIESPGSGNVNGQTAILVQYEPATHGYNWSAAHGTLEYVPGGPFSVGEPFPTLPTKITIAEPIYETHAQVAEILSTFFGGQPPRVRSTVAPTRDFDGDGVLDAQDPDPYDPAH